MKKTETKNSRATVPLNNLANLLLDAVFRMAD
jgi:hypothetical protein